MTAVVVDVAKVIQDTRLKNYELKQEDLTNWEEEHGVIPDGALVFIHTGWGKMVKNYWSYAGLDQHNNLNFPGNEWMESNCEKIKERVKNFLYGQ